MKNILELIEPYNSISIIGMAKNTGKTTTLNYILDEARGKYSLGLTSIGRDGEELDRVTATGKPKIFVENNTIVATAKNALLNSDFTKEILYVTDYTTPMGRVVIANAISAGYVDLAGPSIGTYVGDIVNQLFDLKCDKVIVDGALGRKSFASPSITEGTILATGAALHSDMDKVVDETVFTAEILSIDKLDDCIALREVEKYPENRVVIIDKNYGALPLEVSTSMIAGKEISENIDEETRYVFIKGVLTDKVMDQIMKSCRKMSNITFVVEDGTKIFATQKTLSKFKRLGGVIKALNKINIAAITINPTSPYGYEFSEEQFLRELRERTDIPVFNVLRG
ncbi:hypothetical protein [Oceanirhabdus sp. W0125-5]|uniref:lysine 5,6-aminomutase reactivase subunit KamB n=1 Tax=Oceanirhabdus sp. W0125-5 TaxID=2999116 RepID=UPI0022F31F1A|nr:hypothetical protein [Oceanirhabdus sp. W0125-5]WBW98550.1 hypothetical protein OW730_07280 [Oceanirhabdus sp. W0125-5]